MSEARRKGVGLGSARFAEALGQLLVRGRLVLERRAPGRGEPDRYAASLEGDDLEGVAAQPGLAVIRLEDIYEAGLRGWGSGQLAGDASEVRR